MQKAASQTTPILTVKISLFFYLFRRMTSRPNLCLKGGRGEAGMQSENKGPGILCPWAQGSSFKAEARVRGARAQALR